MSLSILPQELVDQVIDHLWDDSEQLKACTLATPSFAYSSQFHLFQELYLDTTAASYAPSPTKLYELLIEAPHISPFVKQLHLSFASINDPALPIILSALPNVELFSMQGPSDDDVDCEGYRAWEDLPAHFTDALSHFLSTRPITHIYLNTLCDFPLSLLSQCSRLSNFSFSEVIFDSGSVYHDVIPSRPTLQHLQVECSLQCDFANFIIPFADPHGPVDITNLQSLVMELHDQDTESHDQLQQLVDVNGSTLKSLSFNPHHPIARDLSLEKLHHLETLSFQFSWPSGHVAEPLPYLIGALSTVTCSTIVTLHVEMFLHPESPPPTDDSSPWWDLDNLLTSKKFPNLANFQFEVSGGVPPLTADILHQQITASLPKVAERGVLSLF